MNFLFHLYLSGDDPDVLTGNMMGDFVKGRIGEHYPPRLRSGLVLHRRIDSFAQNHMLFQRSKERLNPDYRLWRGVLVDIFYDHFLAVEWSQWSEVPLDVYLEKSHKVLEDNYVYLPEFLKERLSVIFRDLIPSYKSTDGVMRALQRMAQRVQRSNPLAGAVDELILHEEGLRDDFRAFMPEILAFSVDFLNTERERNTAI